MTRGKRNQTAELGVSLLREGIIESTHRAQAVAAAQAAPNMAGQDLAKVVSATAPYAWTESEWKLGSGYGQLQDDLTFAASNAVGMGVVVVASAGNNATRLSQKLSAMA